jgi:glyoxylase-like metal-dependent hydrolase (beta-lactamase superfamily II)
VAGARGGRRSTYARCGAARRAGRPPVAALDVSEDTACASYLFGCLTRSKLAVCEPHVELVDEYLAAADRVGAPIVAALKTHVHADHVSGFPR